MEKGKNQLLVEQPALKCLGCPSIWLNGNGRVPFGFHECGGTLIKTTRNLPQFSACKGSDRTIQPSFNPQLA